MTPRWWAEPIAGDIVWCHFPDDIHPRPKPRPALILVVFDDDAPQFTVRVAYGTSKAGLIHLTKQQAAELALTVFGDDYAVVPYVMPGFALALRAAEAHAAAPGCHGLLLLGHGLFSFGADARESYERHIAAVTRAEAWIGRVRVQVSGRWGASGSAGAGEATVEGAAPEVWEFLRVAPLLRGRLLRELPSRRNTQVIRIPQPRV